MVRALSSKRQAPQRTTGALWTLDFANILGSAGGVTEILSAHSPQKSQLLLALPIIRIPLSFASSYSLPDLCYQY